MQYFEQLCRNIDIVVCCFVRFSCSFKNKFIKIKIYRKTKSFKIAYYKLKNRCVITNIVQPVLGGHPRECRCGGADSTLLPSPLIAGDR